ncbi:C40 family peptidase [Tenacibaculum sp. SG-28]|uniref:C40 family peptidase n=1 Tax=Tenacibaculum sp. SG-28 TaxID=754426 RepID=UPI000CF47B85|nr:C40 family peptidase [Tenacibaculum sp. SG-28]PQJ21144.1 glycoside hydrolase [Tenacibaculum sp. SG-28]
MFKRLAILLYIVFSLTSCGSSKTTSSYNPRKTNEPKATVADKITWTAVSYKGTPYRYGGTTKKGMDCSGLIYTSFKERNRDIPRTSGEMYKYGKPITLKNVQRGDLLFFITSKKRGRINHVGLVTSIKNKTVYFIHSTTSKGVIVSNMEQPYWKRTFVKAKRVL